MKSSSSPRRYESEYRVGDVIHVHDSMQQNYSYTLTEPMGQNFDPTFTPHFTPKEMLKLGIFEGKYCNDCMGELPQDWFESASISDKADPAFNFFKIKSRQPLSTWKDKGWILPPDPRGWFQWYCRYYLGRRIAGVDDKQIARWRAFNRHAGQVRKNCTPQDLSCRPKQRQALLQWSYDCFI